MRRTRKERHDIVARFMRSGETVAKFCGQKGLSPTSLYRWRKEADEGGDYAGLVEIGAQGLAGTGPARNSGGARTGIRITFPCGIVIEAGAAADRELLAWAMGAIGARA